MAGDKKSQTRVVAELLDLIEAKLREQTKGSLGDYIRLVLLQKEIDKDDPRDIKVGWVDKLETQEEETDELQTNNLETQQEETNQQETDPMNINQPDPDSGPSNS